MNAWRSASPITKGALFLSASSAFATLFYAGIAWLQLVEMRSANYLSSRPWIAFDKQGITTEDEFHFSKDRLHADTVLKFHLANTGHSPVYVAIAGKFTDVPDPKKLRGEIEGAEMQCTEARKLLPSRPLTVVPDNASFYGIAYEPGDTDSTTQRAPPPQMLQELHGESSHFLSYVGCIAYQSIADPKSPHQTPFKIYFNIDASGKVPEPEQPILVGEAK